MQLLSMKPQAHWIVWSAGITSPNFHLQPRLPQELWNFSTWLYDGYLKLNMLKANFVVFPKPAPSAVSLFQPAATQLKCRSPMTLSFIPLLHWCLLQNIQGETTVPSTLLPPGPSCQCDCAAFSWVALCLPLPHLIYSQPFLNTATKMSLLKCKSACQSERMMLLVGSKLCYSSAYIQNKNQGLWNGLRCPMWAALLHLRLFSCDLPHPAHSPVTTFLFAISQIPRPSHDECFCACGVSSVWNTLSPYLFGQLPHSSSLCGCLSSPWGLVVPLSIEIQALTQPPAILAYNIIDHLWLFCLVSLPPSRW